MTHYRISERRCTNGKSTFYVEHKNWLPWWSWVGDEDTSDARFKTLQDAHAFIKDLQITCETIIHPVS